MNLTETLAQLLLEPDRPVTKADIFTITPEHFNWDFERWRDAIEAELARSFRVSMIADFPAGDPAEIARLSASYALSRTPTLIDGLSDYSRRKLAALIQEAVNERWTIQQLVERLLGEPIFSRARAELIAVTETAKALGAAKKESAKAQGQNEKRWITQGDQKVCEICRDNEKAMWIKFIDPFPRGHDTIPGHPRCRCDVIYRTAEVKLVTVAEARCPTRLCGKLIARDAPVGARLYCRKCKTEFEVTEDGGEILEIEEERPKKMLRTVQRNELGDIVAILDEVIE